MLLATILTEPRFISFYLLEEFSSSFLLLCPRSIRDPIGDLQTRFLKLQCYFSFSVRFFSGEFLFDGNTMVGVIIPVIVGAWFLRRKRFLCMFLDDAPLVNGIFALFIIDFLSEESISFDDKTKIPLRRNVHFLSSVLSKRAQRFNIFTFLLIIEFFLNTIKILLGETYYFEYFI